MTNLIEKRDLLKKANYKYNFDREIYINRNDRKIFSREAVEDHPLEWVDEKIRITHEHCEWSFFFNGQPSNYIKKELLRVMGQ